MVGVLVLGYAAFLLHQNGPGGVPWLPDCLFHKFTGLHCPGCGMTRAANATLHGHLGAAFRFNPVGMILLPLACSVSGWSFSAGSGESRCRSALKSGRGEPVVILWIVVGFWISRNLPWWPFTLLAPH